MDIFHSSLRDAYLKKSVFIKFRKVVNFVYANLIDDAIFNDDDINFDVAEQKDDVVEVDDWVGVISTDAVGSAKRRQFVPIRPTPSYCTYYKPTNQTVILQP